MRHKFLFRLLALSLCVLFSLTASAYDFMYDGLAYDINPDGNSVTVTYEQSPEYGNPSYRNARGSLTIPSTVSHSGKTYSVTSIGKYAFEYCSGFTGSLTIPNSVTTIASYAFQGCRGFTGSLTIPESVTSIGYGAFAWCRGFTGSLTIPESVTSIGSSAFAGCSGFTGSLTIPNSVTSIGDYAFEYCSGLTSVTIPNSVTSIGSYAFNRCTSLTSLTIGNSVTSIGDYAFENCTSLTSVDIEDLAAWCKIQFNYPTSNPLYYAHRLFINGAEVKDLVVPNSVTSIGDYAFEYCSGLTSVTIPNSVTSIGDYAFESCSGLTSVTIPNSVTSIGSYAFNSCTSLTSVDIEDLAAWCKILFNNPTSNPLCHAHRLFINGAEVKDLVVPNSVTSIGDYAFEYCSGLTSVTIPNSVTTISCYAFFVCSKLAQVELGTGLRTIYDQAFNGCPAITDIISHRDRPAEIVGDTPFSTSIYTTATVHVPSGSLPNYYSAPVWMRFDNFVDDIVVVVKGDVNGDGRVDINDVNAVVNLILGRSTLYRDRADITGDGKVSVSDLNAVVNVMLGRTVN